MRSGNKNPETLESSNPEKLPENKKIYLALLYLVVILVVLLMLYLHIWQHYRMTSIKREISKNDRETLRLQKQIESLEIEISKLSALNRIEKIALEKLKMVPPEKIKYFDVSGVTGEVPLK